MYTVRSLTKDDVSYIYANYMREAFPPSELKTLADMHAFLDRGTYRCFGYYDSTDVLCGYAFFFICGGESLLDYYAMTPCMRGKGIGSAFLLALTQEMPGIIWAEVEAPDPTLNEAENTLRRRRIGFYKRIGFTVTPVHCELFLVHYHILAYRAPTVPNESLLQQVTAFYRSLLRPHHFATRLKLWLEET